MNLIQFGGLVDKKTGSYDPVFYILILVISKELLI